MRRASNFYPDGVLLAPGLLSNVIHALAARIRRAEIERPTREGDRPRRVSANVRMARVEDTLCPQEQRTRRGCDGKTPRATLAAPLATGDAFVGLSERVLGLPIVAWMSHTRAICCDKKHLQPDINPGLASGEWEGLDRHLGAREADIPSVSLATGGDRLDRSRHGTRPAYGQASDLGEHQETVV